MIENAANIFCLMTEIDSALGSLFCSLCVDMDRHLSADGEPRRTEEATTSFEQQNEVESLHIRPTSGSADNLGPSNSGTCPIEN